MSCRCLRRSPELGREEQTVTLVSDLSDLPANVLHLPLEAGEEVEDAVLEVLTMTGTGPWTRRCWKVAVAEDPRLLVVTEASPGEVLELGMVLEALRDRLVRGQEAGTTGTDNNPTRMSMVLLAQGEQLNT